jgi:hypothetical protein
LAHRRTMLVVIPAKGVAAFRLQRFLHDQTRRQFHQFRARPSADDRRPSIRSESDWRVRIDPSILFTGVSPG